MMVMKMGKQFKNLKERMQPEARACADEKAECLLKAMSSAERRAGHAEEESARVNEHEAAADGADSETSK